MSDNSSKKNDITGLFFGSFNPIHIGHLIIADYFVQNTEITKVLFIVSPQSPFKTDKSLLPENERLNLVNLAISDNPNFEATDIEFSMKKPSYTYKTLRKLISKYPKQEFVIVMGLDNLLNFDKWKNHNEILDMAKIFCYPRTDDSKGNISLHPKMEIKNAPIIDVSSSFIRKMMSEGKDPKYFLPAKVYDKIITKGFYKNL